MNLSNDKLKLKYGDEHVLCVSNDSIKFCERAFKDKITALNVAIKSYGEFLPRYRAEIDTSLKQVIPYVVLRCKDKYFVTKRIKGDERLIGQMSIAVGGHVNPCDVREEDEYSFLAAIDHCIIRELLEETTLNLGKIVDLKRYTSFVDESNDVSKVHVCILYSFDVCDDDIKIRETDKLEGMWLTRDEIASTIDKFENWSKISFKLLEDE